MNIYTFTDVLADYGPGSIVVLAPSICVARKLATDIFPNNQQHRDDVASSPYKMEPINSEARVIHHQHGSM